VRVKSTTVTVILSAAKNLTSAATGKAVATMKRVENTTAAAVTNAPSRL